MDWIQKRDRCGTRTCAAMVAGSIDQHLRPPGHPVMSGNVPEFGINLHSDISEGLTPCYIVDF